MSVRANFCPEIVKLLAIVILLSICSSFFHAEAEAPAGPADTAFYKVGVVSRSFPAPDNYNWRGSKSRTLNALVWYPADASAVEKPQFVGPSDIALFTAGSAAPSAPVIARPKLLPLVVMSHGNEGSAIEMAWLGTYLAAHGYVAATVDHPGNSVGDLTPQGYRLWWERARDISVLLDDLLDDPTFGPRIDPERINGAGYSLGGYTMIELAGGRTDLQAFLRYCQAPEHKDFCASHLEFPGAKQKFETLAAQDRTVKESLSRSGNDFRDHRIRSVFAIAPALGPAFTPEGLASVRIPVEIVAGAGDTVVAPQDNAEYFATHIPNARLTMLPGPIGHFTFLNVGTDRGRMILPSRTVDAPGIDRIAVHEQVAQMAVALFDQQSAMRPKPEIAPAPVTPKQPVVDEYHGTKVRDDYRWLENDDLAVRKWVAAQNDRARNYLAELPEYQGLYDWLKKLAQIRSDSYYELQRRGNTLFALNSVPGLQQPVLVTLKSADDLASRRVVVDPNALDPSGHTAIQFYVPSLNGKSVAVCLAEGGSESGTVHVYGVAGGKALPDLVSRVNFPTAGGSVAWNADGSAFYYTRYPHENERPPADLNFYQQIYLHRLGTPDSEDTYVLGKEFPRIAEIMLLSSDDGRYVLASVEDGDGGQYEHFLRDAQGKWTQITRFSDQITAAAFGPDEALYMVSLKNAPRGKMLRLPLPEAKLKNATVVVPESEAVIQGLRLSEAGFDPDYVITGDRLYVVDLIGGPNQIRIFDHQGHELGKVPIEGVVSVFQVISLENGELLFHSSSYTNPSAWYRFDPQKNQSSETALRTQSPVNFDDVEAVREFAVSKDGTKIPLTIIRKKGLPLDGNRPALLTGYGGFGYSLTPAFDPSNLPWLDAGGIVAVANLRGGGEYGREWHEAGMLTRKQNVFDDFIACAEYLIQAHYTNPQKLGIWGGSNGGLLMGAVLTQRPDLFRAVVSEAGLYDMLRFETTQNGQFNVTEYGSVRNPKQFKALYAYSPYERVVNGTRYPAILLTVGENDLRVDPWHSRKFAAKLQAASTSGLPIFLISYSAAGHGGIGAGEDQRIAMEAYNWAFLFDQVGVKFVPPPLQERAK